MTNPSAKQLPIDKPELELSGFERPEEMLLSRLCGVLKGYLEQSQINEVVRAYECGRIAHAGQNRVSGEAYICHPLSVALILADMRMDASGIMSAILHDVIEDSEITKQELAQQFSDEVAEMVDGVSKLSQIDVKSRELAQAENVRKMFLAMAKDLRVIMIKLADRLHNMQTLGVMRPEKKRRIAQETLDIYVPIANRLGMNYMRYQLEELSFQARYPMRYRILEQAVKKARGNRNEIIETLEKSIYQRFQESGLACRVVGREKHVYSLYKKMQNKHISFADVFDVYAFRIYCDKVDTCYRALGVVHNLFKPVPGRFKDYIAMPKGNGYQSLHSIMIGPFGVPLEIQIRTHQMHRMSESGIAAHWLYKSEGEHESSKARANEWLRDLLEIQKTAGDSLEFIENLKIDLFPQEIFVFTRDGAIIKIMKGATIVDFAYAVHTDIGNTCVSARVDNKLVPLQTKLENGMTIDIITTSWARPNPIWLNYIVTAKARTGVRTYLKHFKKKEAVDLGRRLLEKELQSLGGSLAKIKTSQMQLLLEILSVKSLDVLFEEIGLGNRMPFLIAKRLSQDDIYAGIELADNEQSSGVPLMIKGTEGMVVTLAKCCRPIPDDHIIGFYNPGRGIVVHRAECTNSNDNRKKQCSWLEVEWSQDDAGEFSVEIRIELMNKLGSLATIVSTVSSLHANIENIAIIDQDYRVSVDVITLTVRNRVHLAEIIRKLKKLLIVLKITRVKV